MPELTELLRLSGSAFLFGFALTRVARILAARVGLVDRPDGRRKVQKQPVPLAGGVAVFCAALLALITLAVFSPDVAAALLADPPKTFSLLAAALLIMLVGLADDYFTFRPVVKLLGQVLAVLVVVVGGDVVIHGVSIFGGRVDFGYLAVPFTVVWLLACVNALNLIDGMDGLLGTVGGIALVSLAVIAALAGHPFAVVVALALAGAVLGFLVWNLPPASIYMGDAGSMLIGLVIGAVAIPASLKGPATVTLAAPLAVLILPMFDTSAAIVRRKLTGRSFASPDREHLHHSLLARGLTVRGALIVVAVLGVISAAGALLSTALQNDLFAIISAGSVVIALVAGNLFGRTELGLIRSRIWRALGQVEPGHDPRTGPALARTRLATPNPPDFPKDLLVQARDA
jgi:UDP-GlcNAc:undecaprenyl-phosphate GlcNAc-1-phosphate transferase